MRRIGVLGFLLSTMLLAALVSCSSKSPSSSQPSQASGSIVVFAAASLKPAFTQISQQFKTDNPGSGVDFDFGGSSELATQLTQGAAADVFASADTAQMDTVTKAGLLAGNPTHFASNTLVIVAAPGNPKNIGSFADLAKPGLNVVVCREPVPCASATERIEDNTGVHLNPASEEPAVSDVLAKVTHGEADAGLVYVTDARSAGNEVSTVKFAESAAAAVAYPIAVLKHASQPALAQKFIDLVTGATGQKVLSQAGFAGP